MPLSHSRGSADIPEPVQGVWPTQDAIRYRLHRAIRIARRLQGQSPVKDQLDQFRVDIQIHPAGLDPVVDILLRVEISGYAGVLLGRDLLAAMVLARLEELRLLGFPGAVIEHPEVPCGSRCLRAGWEAADLRRHSPAMFPALLVGEPACLLEKFNPLLPGHVHGRGHRNGLIAVGETIARNAPLALVASLPPELRSHWTGLAELRNHAARPVNRTPIHLDGVDDL